VCKSTAQIGLPGGGMTGPVDVHLYDALTVSVEAFDARAVLYLYDGRRYKYDPDPAKRTPLIVVDRAGRTRFRGTVLRFQNPPLYL